MRVEGSTLVDISGLDSLTTHYATPVQANGILRVSGRQEFGPSLRSCRLSTAYAGARTSFAPEASFSLAIDS
jgi:hypothetical protein